MKNIVFLFIFLVTFISLESCNSSIENTTEQNSILIDKNSEEYKNVEAAILDYVEGLYLVDSTRIDKSVSKNLRKIGYWYNPEEKVYRDNLEMTHTQLSNLAANWNKNGDRITEKTPKEIIIFDINSKTASAKLIAAWGLDLFHLAKINNQWKIMNVIWQSIPENE
ncbi:nuclear transport factor 2 family protein [Polaribacter sp.]|uniref:nuclear transport factor 2 family protein n=1 Tax=Polaribacter sp. TaxID=1920175 RepID=UPI003F6BA505